MKLLCKLLLEIGNEALRINEQTNNFLFFCIFYESYSLSMKINDKYNLEIWD